MKLIIIILGCLGIPFGLHYCFTDIREFIIEEVITDKDDIVDVVVSCALGLILSALSMILFCFPIINIIVCYFRIVSIYNNKDKKSNEDIIKKQNIIKKLYENIGYNNLPSSIDACLSNVYSKYKTIIKENIHTELANNRMEYVLNIIQKSKENDLLNCMVSQYKNRQGCDKSNKLIVDLEDMLSSLESFFDEIIKGINDAKDIENKKLEEYMRDKVKEFSDITKSMKDDFEKMNKEGK